MPAMDNVTWQHWPRRCQIWSRALIVAMALELAGVQPARASRAADVVSRSEAKSGTAHRPNHLLNEKSPYLWSCPISVDG